LTGQLKRFEDLAPDDFRRHLPRFQGENFEKNLQLVKLIGELAEKKGVTPSQLALAWLLQKDVVPIPGTKRRNYLDENAAATRITLDAAELAAIESIAPRGVAAGARYAPQMMPSVNR
jgi:aryl-alcohol dehydrogenase-like predicted oxidoreductase